MKAIRSSYAVEIIARSAFATVALATLLIMPISASGAELLGLYTFEGSSPAAFDDVSGQGLDPTTIGAATLNASGYEGQAASFSGSTPIRIPLDINPTVNTNLTIGAWVRANSLYNRGVYGHDDGGWDRGLDLMGGTWRTTGGQSYDSGIAGDTTAWQFVAVRYDGATGQQVTLNVDTNTYSRTLTAGAGATYMVIGAYTASGVHPFDGLIDNFFIFSNVLSDVEIEQIRVNGLSGIEEVAAGLTPITIDVAGDGSDYDETGMQVWRSTNIAKSFDIDEDNVYGTEGLYFIGSTNFAKPYTDYTFANFTKVGATWATVSPGAAAPSYRNPSLAWNYSDIDDPLATPGPSVANWAIQSGLVLSATTGSAGDWFELLKFTADNTAPQKFRIGVMAGQFDNADFHPTGLRIIADSGTAFAVTNSVTNLTTSPARLTGMVFFDVDLKGRNAAEFSVLSQRPATRGSSLAGITFDVPNELPPTGTIIMLN